MNKVTLTNHGLWSLQKVGGPGDSGNVWAVYDGDLALNEHRIEWLPDKDGVIEVGHGIQVMSVTSRDFIRCSPVTEILEVNEDKTEVKFKTRSSTYIARSF